MCGRYTLTLDPAELQDLFDLAEPAPASLAPRYNIAPSQPVAVIANGAERRLELFRWGLIPSWAKDSKIGNQLINARSETVAEKPAFRTALKRRRCLILADGFYEWKREGARSAHKTPMYFQLEKGQPFAFAGLWETWTGPDQVPVRSCTILTTRPNALVEPVHDRMPVILSPNTYADWLSAGELPPVQIQALLQPYGARMRVVTVSPLVNSPAHDSPECVRPINV
jgi:putative SOS response-associated peptidase YedK